jgi:undecaprenyl phosphate N,N'-diacetylbacillosamine 1-phosphate transferase
MNNSLRITYLKQFFDFSISLILIILLSPIIVIVFLILLFLIRENPFFFQFRVGKHEKIFKLIKFKSMNNKRDSRGDLLPDVQRLTKFGSFIRKTSLDELPQLLNVLKGDMSLVGPRPLLVQYLPLYNKKQKRRHEIASGITGWAQINGRNTINWEQKFEYDIWYVDNQSFWLDVKILFFTVLKVFKSEGISQEGQATMEIFNGENEK